MAGVLAIVTYVIKKGYFCLSSCRYQTALIPVPVLWYISTKFQQKINGALIFGLLLVLQTCILPVNYKSMQICNEYKIDVQCMNNRLGESF